MATSRQVELVLRFDEDLDSSIDKVKESLRTLKKDINIKGVSLRVPRNHDSVSQNEELLSSKVKNNQKSDAIKESSQYKPDTPKTLNTTDADRENPKNDYSRMNKILIIALFFNIFVISGLTLYIIQKPDTREVVIRQIIIEPEPPKVENVQSQQPNQESPKVENGQEQKQNQEPPKDETLPQNDKDKVPSNETNCSLQGTIQNILLYGGGAVLAASSLPILAGFGTAGIAAGSVAAGVQAAIGNVAAGSVFATLTSFGMQGTFVTGAAAGAASFGASFVNFTGWFYS